MISSPFAENHERKLGELHFMQHFAPMYPLLSASSFDEKQILFSGFIFSANWQAGRWYLFEFLLATKAHFWFSVAIKDSVFAGLFC